VLIHTVSFGGGSLPGSSLPFYFGSYHAGTTNYCTAYIANFKFYNHALSTQEITADYAENFILPGTPLATGGDQSYLVANPDGTFDEVHIFRKTGILSSPKKLKRSHVFGNASGGSGGNFGSGSSGGAFEDDDYAISPGDHQIVIGEPGLGVAYNVATGQPGEDLTFDDMIAYGGAPGSNGYAQLGGSVGSGDGTSNTADKPRQPEPKRGIGKYVYGNTCGTLTSGIYYACPGSGGIGGVGGNSSNGSTQGGNYGNTKGGAAGPGKTITLTGESIIVGVGAPGCAGTNRADVVPGAPLGRNGGDNENGVNAISYGSGSPGIAGRQSSHKTGAAKKGIFVVRFPVKQRGGNNPAMLMALLP
jgi:hypothetical protein